MYYIYRTTNLINGKTYIGQHKTKDIMNDKYVGSGKILWQAIEKYGKENFKNEVIEVVESKFQANIMEKVWIKKERTIGKAEYNIADGGQGGNFRKSEETKRKLSEALKGNIPWNTGKHLSEETKKKLSEAKKGKHHKGVPHSEESKKKISETLKGRKPYDMTDETRRKMSETRKGKHWKLVDGKRVWY